MNTLSDQLYAEKLRSLGEHFGYPRCCIEQFVEDAVQGRAPGVLRGTVPLGKRNARYVPCDRCKRRRLWSGRTRP